MFSHVILGALGHQPGAIDEHGPVSLYSDCLSDLSETRDLRTFCGSCLFVLNPLL